MAQTILTAVAWPYANGPRHIGHVSGFGVPSDVFSRYQRMAGNRVLMISGTDEHGTPILVQADAEDSNARELADRYNRVIVEDLQGLGLSYDLFTRTTTRNHYATVQEIFRTLHSNGYVVERTTPGPVTHYTRRPAYTHHYTQPFRHGPSTFPHFASQRIRRRTHDDRRHQPVHRAHPAGPLHRRYLPDLRC